jgi:hypothetical protein
MEVKMALFFTCQIQEVVSLIIFVLIVLFKTGKSEVKQILWGWQSGLSDRAPT